MYWRFLVAGFLAASAAGLPSMGGRSALDVLACKTFPVKSTAVSITGSSRTVQTYVHRYDRATNQLHTDATYTDSAGVRQQHHYVHYYSSLADFIRETSTVPPLKLYLRTVVTGTTQMTSTNSFDGSGRQISFVNTSPGSPVQTTKYTAWDAAGRPTRGTRTAPAGTGDATVTIEYDDSARTMTTTVRTPTAQGVVTFIDKETFDKNGNVLKYEMKSNGMTSTTTHTFDEVTTICSPGAQPGSR